MHILLIRTSFFTFNLQLLSVESFDEGNSEGFLALVTYFEVLTEPPLFGLASISTVLDTLESVHEKKVRAFESTSAEYIRSKFIFLLCVYSYCVCIYMMNLLVFVR